MEEQIDGEALFRETPEGFSLRDVVVRPRRCARPSPTGFSLRDVVVRLARPDERVRWDALVEAHHYLGFKRFAGRSLRYVIEWAG